MPAHSPRVDHAAAEQRVLRVLAAINAEEQAALQRLQRLAESDAEQAALQRLQRLAESDAEQAALQTLQTLQNEE